MLHFRLCNIVNEDYVFDSKIFRSFSAAQKAAKKSNTEIMAFPDRQAALAAGTHKKYLLVSADKQPIELNTDQVLGYIEKAEKGRLLGARSCNNRSSTRQAIEEKYQDFMFGFYKGHAVDSVMQCSISRKWVRFSCPIFVNNKKVTKNTLIKLGSLK